MVRKYNILLIVIVSFILLIVISLGFNRLQFYEKSSDKLNNGFNSGQENLLVEDTMIIDIIDAKHLDENKKLISNIFKESVKKDNLWTETILDGHYVSVKFEKNVGSFHDITIYPKVISGDPVINVYEKDKDDLIAQFVNIRSNEYNKIYLTDLQNIQDTFDLQIIGGDVQFDSIIDPSVASCGTLNTPGATYTQTANIIPNVSSIPCINITADNIIFNGAGFWISNSTFNNAGIYANGRVNLTIQNVNVSVNKTFTNGYGLNLININNSIIENSIFNFNYNGIYFITGGMNNNLTNITANFNGNDGVLVSLPLVSPNNNRLNNIFANNNAIHGAYIVGNSESLRNITANNNAQAGLYLDSGSTNIAVNNVTANNNSLYGIGIIIGNHHQIDNFTLNNNLQGIYLYSTNNVTFRFGVVNSSRANGVFLHDDTDDGGATVTENVFRNVNVTNTNASKYSLYVELDAAEADTSIYMERNYLMDSLFSNYSIAPLTGNVVDYGIKLVFNDSRFGEIRFLDYLNGTGTNLSADVRILNNSVSVRSEVNAGLNKSANVTLNGLFRGDNTGILRNGVPCPVSVCYNFTSLNAGTVLFNVSYWTNYSINHTNIAPVVNITSPTAQTYTTNAYLVNISINEAGYCNYSLNGGLANKSLTPNSLNTSFNATEAGISNGDYILSAFCEDIVGNTNYTSNVSFTISVSSGSSTGGSSGGSGGSSGGGVAPPGQTYDVDPSELNTGYSEYLSINDKYTFSVSGEKHNLTLNLFNTTTARVTIQSTPVVLYLIKDVERKVDLNSDGVNELSLLYKGISANKAELFIRSLIRLPEENEGNETAIINESNSGDIQDKRDILVYKIGALVLIIIILVIILIAIKIRKHKRDKIVRAFNKRYS